MNADGSNAHHVAGGFAAGGHYPAWSPDGSLIAFAESGVVGDMPSFVIKVVAPDGTGLRELRDASAMSFFPAWSPDGSKLAFTCERDICVMNADGSGVVNLTGGDRNTYEREPDWAPDGSEIVFASDRGASYEMQLYAMSQDGTNVRLLSDVVTGCCAEPDW